MTPEERFTKIENTLKYAAEIHARHSETLQEHRARIKEAEEQINKVTAGVRDLIVVSRTLLDAQQAANERGNGLEDLIRKNEESRIRANEEFDVKFGALIQAQMETERKLQAWIERHGNGREQAGPS